MYVVCKYRVNVQVHHKTVSYNISISTVLDLFVHRYCRLGLILQIEPAKYKLYLAGSILIGSTSYTSNSRILPTNRSNRQTLYVPIGNGNDLQRREYDVHTTEFCPKETQRKFELL